MYSDHTATSNPGLRGNKRNNEKFKALRTIENLAKIKQVIQSTTHMSNADILKYSRASNNIL